MSKENRKDVLLRAAFDLLKRCSDSYYVLSVNEACAQYDGVPCDGCCLITDIADELGIDEETEPYPLVEDDGDEL